ncbi:prostaglandin reductase 1-like [Cimex lectularius]|uniref:Prostaglandin reductase 1 n=1 Tax=Cimex lectularius TaxID=79782 RepID=A0A8I6S6E8_CIMLE|nr:prostaglandin reductase 1-like [Cimex lectularius]
MPNKVKKFIYAEKFEGAPKPSNFRLEDGTLPSLKAGEVHFKAVAISVDPYMRAVGSVVPPGNTMFGAQVAKVVASNSPKFKVGDHAVGYFGWQTDYVGRPEDVLSPFGGNEEPYLLPDFKGLPLSLGLGVLGMPGNTAYFGLLEICKPVQGEVVVVSGAAGAVGSLVGQIAKIKGAKVIGFAGSDKKVDWLLKELKFDWAFNYKKIGVLEALKKAAPEGVDCYFDNVGGQMSSDVISCMNNFGRVAVCGSVSTYNETKPVLASAIQMDVILKQLKIEGFLVQRWLGMNRWFEGIKQNIEWIKQGKLVFKETTYHGFEKLPEAFLGLFKGENSGKAVVLV